MARKPILSVVVSITSLLLMPSLAFATTIDWSGGAVQSTTLSSNDTLAFANGTADTLYSLIVKQDGTGSHTVTWPGSVLWENSATPTTTPTANAIDVAQFIYDGTHYLGSYHTAYGVSNSTTTSTLLNNLAAYWKFDGSSGNASDTVSSNNTLTNNNAIAYVTGKINNAGDYTATSSQFFSLSGGTGLNPTGDFSVSMWVKLASQPTSGNEYGLVSKWATGNGQYGFTYLNSSGTYQLHGILFDSGAPSSNVNYLINQTLSTGTWYMLTFTWVASTNTMTMYVNGSSIGTSNGDASVSTLNTGNGNFLIGEYQDPSSRYMNGDIDEVGFWSRALTSTEVSELYNGGSGDQYPF